jgi:short-subunit dehydrogenase
LQIRLKKIENQVIVITGASSGIGLTTARLAARRGATLALAARNQNTLDRLCAEIRAAGGKARGFATDVSRLSDVQALADNTLQEFGTFDTWINNAGGSVYGQILDTPIEDERKLFEINYWGIVYGSRIAATYLRTHGGAIINLGSVVSDRAVPLQAAYSASKHAIKAYTDVLRAELEKENAPISVTLIKPAAIDTPFFRHAKTYMNAQPIEPSPLYAPEVVADAILFAAINPIRDILAGGTAPLPAVIDRLSTRLGDRLVNEIMFVGQRSSRPPGLHDNQFLQHGSLELQERGNYEGVRVFERSPYTNLAMRPVLKRLLVGGSLLSLAVLLRSRRH